MAGFLSELEHELSFEYPNLGFVRAAQSRLKEWEKYYNEMERDKGSSLWGEPLFVSIHKEYRAIRSLLKARKLLPSNKSIFLNPEDK